MDEKTRWEMFGKPSVSDVIEMLDNFSCDELAEVRRAVNAERYRKIHNTTIINIVSISGRDVAHFEEGDTAKALKFATAMSKINDGLISLRNDKVTKEAASRLTSETNLKMVN